MLTPTKYLRFSESILGLAAFLLKLLAEPSFPDQIWFRFEKLQDPCLSEHRSFDQFLLAIDFLYLMGLIQVEENGRLRRASA